MFAGHPLFQQTGLQKMCELYILTFGGRFGMCQKGLEDCLRPTLANLTLIKSAPANKKKDFYTNMHIKVQ